MKRLLPIFLLLAVLLLVGCSVSKDSNNEISVENNTLYSCTSLISAPFYYGTVCEVILKSGIHCAVAVGSSSQGLSCDWGDK